MKTMLAAAAAVVLAMAAPHGGAPPTMNEMTADTYENLATAIIAIRATEDNLVKGILVHAELMAQRHLAAAVEASGSDRASELEGAADEISDIANEGDKRIQAVRQRLLKAGHHHHTDAETQDDYMFVNSAEKKDLLELARKVSRLGPRAPDTDIRQAGQDLRALFARIIEPE